MQKNVANKALGMDEKIVPVKNKFFFPDHGVTIEAETKEDAEKKLAEAKKKE